MRFPAIIVPCSRLSLATGLAAVMAVWVGGRVEAHTFERTRTELRVEATRSFQATLRLDLDALALGIDPSTDPETAARALVEMSEAEFQKTEEGLLNLLSRRLRVRVDGKPVAFKLSFPERRSRSAPDGLEVFGLAARLEGRVPDEGEDIQLFASRAFPAI